MDINRRHFCQSALVGSLATAVPVSKASAGSWPKRALPAEISAVTLDGENTSIERVVLAELDASLQGQLLIRGDYGYDGARSIWNGMHDATGYHCNHKCAKSAGDSSI